MKITETERQKWVAALRSGKYVQGGGSLKRHYHGEEKPRYCCLGVLCEELNIPSQVSKAHAYAGLYDTYAFDLQVGFLPRRFENNAGRFFDPLTYEIRALSYLNDDGFTFKDISNIIETCQFIEDEYE